MNASSPACVSCAVSSNYLFGFSYLSPYVCHATVPPASLPAPGLVAEFAISSIVTGPNGQSTSYDTSAEEVTGGVFSAVVPGSVNYPIRWVLLGCALPLLLIPALHCWMLTGSLAHAYYKQ